MSLKHFTDFARPGSSLTLDEAVMLHQMATGGDIQHVDGDFIRALAELADQKATDFMGTRITRKATRDPQFTLSRDDRWTVVHGAVEALVEAEAVTHRYHGPARLNRWKEVEPDHEPDEVPNWSDSFASKCEADQRNVDAMRVKGITA